MSNVTTGGVTSSDLQIDRPLVVLTGGIATGKSSVAERLRQLGIEVIDTDRIAHQLTAPDGTALAALRTEFGDSIFNTDGTLNCRTRRKTSTNGHIAIDKNFKA